MTILRQSTERKIRVGPFMDETDGITPVTGVALGAADVAHALKAAGAAAVDISGLTWADVTNVNGWYDLTLTTSVTDTVGDLTIVIQYATDYLPVMVRCTVVEEAVYDALYKADAAGWAKTGYSLASDGMDSVTLPADIITAASINTGALTADAFAADAIVAATLATGAITADAFAADAIVAATLATGAITADAIADNAIDAGAIADNAITAAKIATGAIDADALAADCITNAKIADDAIGDEHWNVSAVAGCAVTSIANDAITAASINTGALTADAFAADAIVAATLATGAITADAFAADAIVAATLATGAITADAFAADAIVAATLATGAITADAFAADAIAASAIAANALDGKGDWTIPLLRTTITVSSQTSFSLAAGSADNDAYNGCVAIITDQSTGTQKCVAGITDYTGVSKTVTLGADPGVFTMATGDSVEILPKSSVGYVGGEIASGVDGAIDANVTQISGDSTAADNAESFFDGTGYAGTNNVIPTVTTLTGHTAQTGDSYAIVNGDHGLVSIQDDIDAILTDTAEIGAAGAGLTAVPWNAAWDAEVQSECADALAAINLDHLMLTGDATLTNIVADNTALAHLMTVGADISGFGSDTDTLQALGATLGSPAGASVSADVAAVKAETASILTDTAEIGAAGAGLTEAGGTGDHLTALATAAALTTVDNEIADIDTVVDAIKVTTDKLDSMVEEIP